MNCSQIQNLLSDYYDHELSADLRQQVETHLASCESCAELLAGFERLSQLTENLSEPVPPANLWDNLERQLQEEEKNRDHGAQDNSSIRTRSKSGLLKKYSLLIIAASLLATVGVGYFVQTENGHHAHHETNTVFKQYLAAFEKSPESAQQILLKNYQNDLVEPQQAEKLLGYQPAVARKLPADYEVEASYVMKMPCCTCLQTICKRKDGSRIVIFEHDDETPQWFEGQPQKNMTCNGKTCCLVNLDVQMAASWQHGKRHITVIGIHDEQEVDQLIAWSDQAGDRS